MTPTVTPTGTASDRQKEEECIALTRFRDASGQLPGFLERVVPDPPDFLITDGSRTISVEMTRYLQGAGKRGSPAAEREAMEMRVVALAQELFEAAHPGVIVNVSPHFKIIPVIKPPEVERFAKALAALVWNVLPAEPSPASRVTTSRADWYAIDGVGLGNVLATMSLHRVWLRVPIPAYWGSLSGIASNDIAEIERSIRNKEHDLPRYSVTADERWLIVYSWHLRSAFFDELVLSAGMFSSTFDRVFYLDATIARFVAVA